jgi:hypothetical protein
MSTATRASSRRKGPLPLPVEPTKTREIFRTALAQYLRDAGNSIKEANVFTIRGRGNWGLSFELQIGLREYSALLLGSGLIKLKSDGGVNVLADEWNNFLIGYQLRDKDCEFTRGFIKYASFVDSKAPIEPKGANNFHILRIGEGDAIVATQRIIKGENPPEFNCTIRSAHRRLFMTISEEMAKLLRDKSDEVAAVMKWVAMEDIFNNTDEGQRGGAAKRARSPPPSTSKPQPKSPSAKLPKKLKSPPSILRERRWNCVTLSQGTRHFLQQQRRITRFGLMQWMVD